jgi:hypothetical protein
VELALIPCRHQDQLFRVGDETQAAAFGGQRPPQPARSPSIGRSATRAASVWYRQEANARAAVEALLADRADNDDWRDITSLYR